MDFSSAQKLTESEIASLPGRPAIDRRGIIPVVPTRLHSNEMNCGVFQQRTQTPFTSHPRCALPFPDSQYRRCHFELSPVNTVAEF